MAMWYQRLQLDKIGKIIFLNYEKVPKILNARSYSEVNGLYWLKETPLK